MNFDDDDGRQRPIGGNDALDRKIVAASPSPYNRSKKQGGDGQSGNDDEHVTLNDADVLCGRGKTSFNHAGNKRFRDLITSNIPEYNKSESRLAKSLVVHTICESIRGSGGRFLKTDGASGKWKELDDRACREKVGHAIRDAATTTQTRREKKRALRAQYSVSGILPTGNPSARYTEMKLDTPDPVSFHDIVHFSNLMSGPPLDWSSFEPTPLAESAVLNPNQPPPAAPTSTSTPANSADDTATNVTQDHPPDEQSFLEQINQVLGPMPSDPDADPLADLLNTT